jgi:hypothetical protein
MIATAADHEAYGSVTWLCALESAEENWTDHNGRPAESDTERAEITEWARGYIADGLTEVYEGDNLDLIAGAARPGHPFAKGEIKTTACRHCGRTWNAAAHRAFRASA